MNTTITKLLKPSKMMKMFDLASINIRDYRTNAITLDGNDKSVHYQITIRHNEGEDIHEMFRTAYRSLNEEYNLGDSSINGIKLNEKICNLELHEFQIIDVDTEIENLCRWISECQTNEKELMLQDLKQLINTEDEYVLSSGKTNDYMEQDDSRFQDTCSELLELHNTIENE